MQPPSMSGMPLVAYGSSFDNLSEKASMATITSSSQATAVRSSTFTDKEDPAVFLDWRSQDLLQLSIHVGGEDTCLGSKSARYLRAFCSNPT